MITRQRVLTVAPAVLLAVLTTSLAVAAEDVLSLIPEKALGFAVVNRLAQTDAKVQALGKQMQIPVPSLLTMLKANIGVQKGLDEKASAALVVMPGEDTDSQPFQVLFAPVTDFGQFVGQFQPEDATAKIVRVKILDNRFLVGEHGDYAVFVETSHLAFLKKLLDSPHRISEEITPLKQWLAENDVAAVLTHRGVALISSKGQEELRKVKDSLAALPDDIGADMQTAIAVFEIYEKILEALGEEVNVYAAGARVDQEGAVHVTDWAVFTAGGRAAELIAKIKPPEAELLAGLPSRPFVVAGGGALPEGLATAMTDFSVEIMKAAPKLYGFDEEQTAKLAEISSQSIKGIRGMAMLFGVGRPGDALMSNMVVVMKVTDSGAYLANYKKTLKVMNELLEKTESSILSPTEFEDVKIGEVTALKLSMKIPLAPGAENMPGYDEMMKTLFGPDAKMTAYLAAADKQTIVSAYTNPELLLKCLKAAEHPKSGLAGAEDVAQTAALLPPGAQWIGYWSPKGTIDFISRIIPAVGPPGEEIELPDFPATPPIGFAAKTTRDGVRGYLVVPADVLKAIGEFVVEVIKKTEKPAPPPVEQIEAPLF